MNNEPETPEQPKIESVEIDVKAILRRSHDEITRMCIESAKNQYARIIANESERQVREIIEKVFADGLAEEVQAKIVAARPAILAQISAACDEIGASIGQAIKDKALKNLEQSYHLHQVTEAIFSR